MQITYFLMGNFLHQSTDMVVPKSGPASVHMNFFVMLFEAIIVSYSLVLLVLDWQLYILSSVPLLHESSTFVWGVLRVWPDML